MKNPLVTIVGARHPGKVISPATYQFSRNERIYFDIDAIRQYDTVVLADIASPRIEPPEVPGLSSRFAGLKSSGDINRFTREYGLLGLLIEPESRSEPPAYGESWFEPLSAWRHHIENVRRLMLLYRALSRWKRGFDVEIEELLRVESLAPWGIDINLIQWWDGTTTDIQIDDCKDVSLPAVFGRNFADSIDIKSPDEYGMAVSVLSVYLRQNLQGGINLDFSKIIPAKNAAIGFRIEETRSTPYLLAAIYYDLWRLITEDRPVIRCEFCGLPLERKRRQKFCSNACKQADYRKRKEKGEGN